MPAYEITASIEIPAKAPVIYGIIADYRKGHAKILPRQFHSLTVEEGGYGAGSVISFKATMLGTTQLTRARVTEPEPGRVLQEADLAGRFVTTFTLDPSPAGGTRVTIRTVAQSRGGPLGWLERTMSTRFLRKTFEQELALLARVATAA